MQYSDTVRNIPTTRDSNAAVSHPPKFSVVVLCAGTGSLHWVTGRRCSIVGPADSWEQYDSDSWNIRILP